jgi:selenocysteine lyase/cysteine desulfurase
VDQKSDHTSRASDALNELENSIYHALETYSNVHRGSGHYSFVTTQLYEEAREIVLEYLNLDRKKYQVIFCSPLRAIGFISQLKQGTYHLLSSADLGLSIGVRAVAIRKNSLPGGRPLQPGGGAARLVSPGYVVWDKVPDRLEAGTPAVINIIAFVKALKLQRKYGEKVFSSAYTTAASSDKVLTDDFPGYDGILLLEKLRETLIGRDVMVPVKDGSARYINLDNAASTQTFQPILDSFIKSLFIGKESAVADSVKVICADFLNAPSSDYDIIFTSNTTEAVNLAAENFKAASGECSPLILNTILEHSSNDLPWRTKQNSGVIRLSVNESGFIDLAGLEKTLSEYNQERVPGKERISLVSITGASNVLGTCNNLAEISTIVHRYGASLLVDAAQLIAHRKTDLKNCGIDFFVFSAHKAYAPFGTGALVARKGLIRLAPEQLEKIQDAGQENIAGIAALGKAFLLLQSIGMSLICSEEEALTKYTLEALSTIEGLKVFGISDPGSDNIKNKTGVIPFFIKSLWPDKVSRELAARGIGVRYGCHCAHMLVKHLLKVPPGLQKLQHFIAVAFPRIVFPGVVRISFGLGTTKEDIDKLISSLKEIISSHKKEKTDIKIRLDEFTRAVSAKVYGN